MMNKIFLIVIIFCISLISAKEFTYATVKHLSIFIYDSPKNESSYRENLYKFDDLIKIYSCNNYGWCKTKSGYVKKYLVKFERGIPRIVDNLEEKSLKKQVQKEVIKKEKRKIFKKSGFWRSNQIFQRTSVDENVKDILTSIALQNRSQIIFDKEVAGVETLTIDEMPLEGAFNLILGRNNLEYKWEGNILIVSSITAGEIKKEFIILKNLTVNKLVILLKRYNIYRDLKDKTIFDRDMNSVFIEAQTRVIDDLKNMITQFELAETLRVELRLKRTKDDMEYKKLQLVNDKNIALKNKKQRYGISEFENWRMEVSIVPLKYINVTSKEIEFQGKKIVVESLEDTLRGLLGTGYVNSSDANKTHKNNAYDVSYLKVDARTNSIIIKDYPDRIEEIKKIISKLDIPAKLVEIEVTIATGTTGFTNTLGISLGGIKNGSSESSGLSTSSTIADNLNSGGGSNLLQPSGALGLSGSMLFTGAKGIINAQLNMMEEEGNGRVLSNPRIVTLNNREATIISGKSISIPVTTDNKIELETVDTGISIKATPHIIEKDGDDSQDIMLDISIESSALGDTTGGAINKTTNKINTNVIMKTGQTLILGGLFQYTENKTKGGVPFFKDIPFLGVLFSTKSKLLNKSELVFFITPRIITGGGVNMKVGHYQKSLEENRESFFEEVQR